MSTNEKNTKDYKPGEVIGKLTDNEWLLYQDILTMAKKCKDIRKIKEYLEYVTRVLNSMRTLWWHTIRIRLKISKDYYWLPLEIDEETHDIQVNEGLDSGGWSKSMIDLHEAMYDLYNK